MTDQEFKASLTKEQKKFYEARIKEAFSLEEQYYRQNVTLKQEIMLILHALNFQPIQSVPHLCEMMRGTRERFLKAKSISPARREEMDTQIECMRGRMNDLADQFQRIEAALNEIEKGVRGYESSIQRI